MVLHVPEDIVVYVAEEAYLGLHAPVVLNMLEGRMAVEHAAVPPAHLVVGYLAAVLHFVLLENLSGLLVEFLADPVRHGPVFIRNDMVVAFGFGDGLGAPFEFVGEGDVVEESPRVVEFVVPCCLELFHGRNEVVEFFIADEGEERGVDAGWGGGVWGVVACCVAPERLGRLTDGVEERVFVPVGYLAAAVDIVVGAVWGWEADSGWRVELGDVDKGEDEH